MRCPEVALIAATGEGVITAWSPAAESLFGYTTDEMVGRTLDALDSGQLRSALKRVYDGAAAEDFFASFRAKDGRTVEVSLSVSAVCRDAEGAVTGLSIAAQDVGRRRGAENLGSRLIDVFEGAGTAIAVVRGPDTTLELVNPAFARLHGGSVEDLLNLPILDLVSPEAREEAKRSYARVYERGHDVFELVHQRRDGTTFPALVDAVAVKDARGKDLYEIVTVHGLSDVKWLADPMRGSGLAPLERRTRLLQTILESATDLIFLKDRDGQYLLASPAAAGIWGRKPEDLVGKKDTEIFPPDAAARVMATDREILATGNRMEFDIGIVVAGVPRIFHTVKVPLRDPSGAILGILGISRDVTEQRLHHAELESRVAERTLQLGAFTYTVAHDLRAPLRAMAGLGQLLLQDYGTRMDETGQEYVRRIAEAASRMDLLIRDLLHYSQMSERELPTEPLALEEIVDSILSEMDPQLEAARAEVHVERPLHRVLGHRAGLKQAFYHLVSNALKFVPWGVQPRIRIWSEAKDGIVLLWVEDNGIGIPPEYQERIFRVFERLHRPDDYPGTGMGLAIVKKAVERMGGRVGVVSEPGRGSRFWLEVPRTE